MSFEPFLQSVLQDMRHGRFEDAATHFHLPCAVFVGRDNLVFKTRAELTTGIADYSRFLLSKGWAKTEVFEVSKSFRSTPRFSVQVEKRHLNGDGEVILRPTVQYFCELHDNRPFIVMMHYHRISDTEGGARSYATMQD